MKPLYQRAEIRIAPDPRGTESSVNTSRLMGINACENLEEVQVLLGLHSFLIHPATVLECIQLGRDRGSSQLSFQCCKQPLHVVLFEVKLMCHRRGEDLKEDQLMQVALS